jgi:hypothetical protein
MRNAHHVLELATVTIVLEIVPLVPEKHHESVP